MRNGMQAVPYDHFKNHESGEPKLTAFLCNSGWNRSPVAHP
jgi:hypothetical protein